METLDKREFEAAWSSSCHRYVIFALLRGNLPRGISAHVTVCRRLARTLVKLCESVGLGCPGSSGACGRFRDAASVGGGRRRAPHRPRPPTGRHWPASTAARNGQPPIENCVSHPERTHPANHWHPPPVVCGTTQFPITKYVPDQGPRSTGGSPACYLPTPTSRNPAQRDASPTAHSRPNRPAASTSTGIEPAKRPTAPETDPRPSFRNPLPMAGVEASYRERA